MITFKINKTPYPIPTYWADVTYRQYVELIHTATLTDHISVFTGIPRETLEQAEIKNLEKISLALSFLSFAPKFERSNMVGPYVMPTDIRVQSTGQFENLRRLMLKLPKDWDKPELLSMEDFELLADLFLSACAVYCQKIRDGKFDSDKIDEVKEELKDCSCAEVIGTGAFFLFKPLNLLSTTTNRSPRFTQRLKNMIQGLPGYQKTLDSLQRYFGLAVK